MNVGLFWFFIQAWAEKAGYLRNPHSNDEIDLPFEFAGTMLGFWMARVLTRPFDFRGNSSGRALPFSSLTSLMTFFSIGRRTWILACSRRARRGWSARRAGRLKRASTP